MKKTFLLLSLLLASLCSFGQANNLTQTTLSAAITDPAATVITLTSATGVTANKTSIYVDGELMSVLAVNGTTLTVARSSKSSTHKNSALVYLGSPTFFQSTGESGSCTKSTLFVHPHIDTKAGVAYYCVNSQWVGNPTNPELTGLNGASGRFRYPTVTVGSVAFGSLGTSKTTVAGTLFCADVFVERTFTATGIGVLNAGTVGTDNGLVALYDTGGALVANSATAGAVTASANAFQQRNFTATVLLIGPAQYFACYQSNGTTDNIRTVAASTFIDVLTTSFTGVFGTVPATMTVPTTFTADVGPIAYVF